MFFWSINAIHNPRNASFRKSLKRAIRVPYPDKLWLLHIRRLFEDCHLRHVRLWPEREQDLDLAMSGHTLLTLCGPPTGHVSGYPPRNPPTPYSLPFHCCWEQYPHLASKPQCSRCVQLVLQIHPDGSGIAQFFIVIASVCVAFGVSVTCARISVTG